MPELSNLLRTLGATNLSKRERSALDYYGTDPKAVEALLRREDFAPRVWEPASGHGNIARALRAAGHEVVSTDVVDYGFQDSVLDFLRDGQPFDGDIITNPPYSLAEPFIRKALDLVGDGSKVAMFLRLQILEGRSRYENIYCSDPPKAVYVFPRRVSCSPTDDFTERSAVAYCWVVWVKGRHLEPVVRWFDLI